MRNPVEAKEEWQLGDRTAQHVLGLVLITLFLLSLLVYSVFVSLSATTHNTGPKTGSRATQQLHAEQR